MPRSARTWWLAYLACVIFVLGGLAIVSTLVLRMEIESARMRAVADRNAELSATLWDMEAWLIPHLGRESTRRALEYRSYVPVQHIYTRYYAEIAPGDVYSPSPLMTFDSAYFPIHFEISPDGSFSSPQVPEGNELDLAQATVLPEGWVERKGTVLASVTELLAYESAATICEIGTPLQLEEVEQNLLALGFDNAQSAQIELQSIESPARQEARAWQDFGRRAEAQQRSQQVLDREKYANIAPEGVSTKIPASDTASKSTGIEDPGPFVPVWLGDQLLFLREARTADGSVYQGFLADWSRIRAELLAEPRLRGVDIEPLATPGDAADQPFRLASIPAILTAPPAQTHRLPLLTPTRITLGVSWLFVAVATVAAGLTLRSTIDFAHRRSRFASAVTHELRTPLTTFQMYSEMLADGMVSDPDHQRTYHETLREESTRLNAIVENVLAYARIQDGLKADRYETLSLNDLVDRLLPPLRRRAEQAGIELRAHADALGERRVNTEVETIEQILMNLVDNACKYGCVDDSGSIDLVIRVKEDRLIFEVRDEGPGVEDAFGRAIYQPFDRGSVEPGSSTPGLGLGLALCRELAASLGGSITHQRTTGTSGACFTLTMPLIGDGRSAG